jgi:SAM-dependent methyltransferase
VFSCDNIERSRETLVCRECGTISRYRSVARGILLAIGELSHVDAYSISELALRDGTPLSVYDTQVPFHARTSYPIPDLLSECRWIDMHTSVFRPSEPWGIKIGTNTTNQNLEMLTFPDNRFDIVVTSDVMEHVRLDDKAHREIRRVLKTNGIYVFTVPHFRHASATLVRVEITDPDDPSKDKHLMEPEYHGDPNSDCKALCYRVYGADLDDMLRSLGFTVEYSNQDFPELGIVNAELFYCRIRK